MNTGLTKLRFTLIIHIFLTRNIYFFSQIDISFITVLHYMFFCFSIDQISKYLDIILRHVIGRYTVYMHLQYKIHLNFILLFDPINIPNCTKLHIFARFGASECEHELHIPFSYIIWAIEAWCTKYDTKKRFYLKVQLIVPKKIIFLTMILNVRL